jgi:hypothetical protein
MPLTCRAGIQGTLGHKRDGTSILKKLGRKERCNSLSLRNGEKRHIIMQRSTKRGQKGGMTKA